MVTWSLEAGHVPFEMVHWKTFAPTDKPVTADVGEFKFVIVPVPEIRVHAPVPVVGIFPANVVDEEQLVWSGPAVDVVGLEYTMIVTSSKETGHVPFEVVQRKTFAPTLKPFTFDVADDGETIVPVPEIKVHVPDPIEGMFPASVTMEEQIA